MSSVSADTMELQTIHDRRPGIVTAFKNRFKHFVPARSHMRLRIFYTRLRFLALFPVMAGTRHYCPCCRRRFGRFFPDGLRLQVFADKDIVGGAWTPGTRCPWCWSSERDRLLCAYFEHRPQLLSAGGRVLHLAPEHSLQQHLRSAHGVSYVAGDIASPFAMVKMDILMLPLASCSADAVVCNHVLEHVPEDSKAMSEIFRVLKPGGWAILQVPIARGIASTEEDPAVQDPKDRERRYGQFDHVRLYEQQDYRRRLESAGFEVTIENALELCGPERVREWRLNAREDVHLCRKP